jgi:hypothetical protein
VILFFAFRTSGYSLSPGSITTNLGDPKSLFSLGTNLSCVPGNTEVGAESREEVYVKQDGRGYGICGAEELIKEEMNYKILGEETALGD